MVEKENVQNIKKIMEMVESGKTVDALYIEEQQRVPGEAPSGLKIYLATEHQAYMLADALHSAVKKRTVHFMSTMFRPRLDSDGLKIGKYIVEIDI